MELSVHVPDASRRLRRGPGAVGEQAEAELELGIAENCIMQNFCTVLRPKNCVVQRLIPVFHSSYTLSTTRKL